MKVWVLKRRISMLSGLIFIMTLLFVILSLLITFPSLQTQILMQNDHPEQVHLSLGQNYTEMVISWVIKSKLVPSEVELKKTGSETTRIFDAKGRKFNTGTEDEPRIIYLYDSRITGLHPHSQYSYRVVPKNETLKSSKWFFFKTFDDKESNLRVAFYGDLGIKTKKKDNAVGLKFLKSLVKEGSVDLVLHAGDIAYDLIDQHGKRGDKFFKSIQPIASRVPYQVVPGNHEQEHDVKYRVYNNRFNMIDSKTGEVNNYYYSFNVGLIHFIGINTQFHEDDQIDKMKKQYKWLKHDLKEANANRKSRPWIIVMNHQPLYCKKESGKECKNYRQFKFMRKHTNLEELFYEYGVDVAISGHEHLYKRTFPVFRNTICSSKHNESNPYDEPRGVTHVTSGSIGRLAKTKKSPFTALTYSEYGLSIIHSVTQTSLTINFVNIHGKIRDRINIVNKNLSGKRYSCKEAEKAKVEEYWRSSIYRT